MMLSFGSPGAMLTAATQARPKMNTMSPILSLAASIALALALSPGAIAAERPLTGPEITVLLSGNTALGKTDRGPWKQYFDTAGGTAYASGTGVSRGAWAVQGNKFCSQWPPNEAWVCYAVTGDLEGQPRTLTWIGAVGSRYPAEVEPGNGL